MRGPVGSCFSSKTVPAIGVLHSLYLLSRGLECRDVLALPHGVISPAGMVLRLLELGVFAFDVTPADDR